MMCHKNREIQSLREIISNELSDDGSNGQDQRFKAIETALYQLTVYSKCFLKTHISNREQLEILTVQAERALAGGRRVDE